MNQKFTKGEKITYQNDTGHVNFIGDKYITMSLNRRKDINSMWGYKETNLLIYRTHWKDIVYHDREKVSEESIYKSQENRYEDIQ
jgi:hypothetical protein